MNRLPILAGLALLAGCAGPTAVPALEVALTGADQAALAYVTLPLCPSTNGTACSDPAKANAIKVAAQAAYTTVKGAEAGTTTEAAAQAAITALVALTPPAK